jgi:hypothetical protein
MLILNDHTLTGPDSGLLMKQVSYTEFVITLSGYMILNKIGIMVNLPD